MKLIRHIDISNASDSSASITAKHSETAPSLDQHHSLVAAIAAGDVPGRAETIGTHSRPKQNYTYFANGLSSIGTTVKLAIAGKLARNGT